jgi:DNA-binding HxlR family transcriptional regulator
MTSELPAREGACPIRDVLDRVADRWSLLVLCALAENGASRFSALRSNIEDISPRMLAQTLRRLEQHGFLSRTVYPTNPPRVEYALTPLGKSLLEPVWALVRWARRNQRRVLDARRRYLPRQPGLLEKT